MRLGELWEKILAGNAGISERAFLASELEIFMNSKKRKNMLDGRRYYDGKHDIENKRRTAPAENNKVIELAYLPNNKITDNKFDDLVDQKVNYLMSKPIEVRSNDNLDDIFTKAFFRRLKNIGKDVLIGGIGCLYPYLDETGIQFKRLKPENILLFWADDEHEKLDAFLYFYDVEVYYPSTIKNTITKVEYYHPNGIKYFIYSNGQLSTDTDKQETSHLLINNEPFTWNKIPLIVFKYNDAEIPLICRVKCLQDALNTLLSNFADNMEEDVRSTLLIIKNYDGEDLAEFRRNVATYGAVKIKTVDGVDGGIDSLQINVNSDNYQSIIKMLKTAIIENGRGFDAKDDRMSNNPNQMNIQSMYSDIDLDANEMENEFQASFEQLMWFVNTYKGIVNKPASDDVQFIFNRDLPINESDVIENCAKSEGIISKETIIANHPWTIDTDEELARLKKEQEETNNDLMGKYPLPAAVGGDPNAE